MGTMGAGVTFGITSWKSVCRSCGYRGEPLLFPTEEAYQTFLEQLKTTKESLLTEHPQGDDIEEPLQEELLSQEEQEVIRICDEISAEYVPAHKDVFSDNKSWIPEIIIAMISAGIILFGFNVSFFTSADLWIIFLYSLVLFVTLTFLNLIICVVIEYIFISIKQ